MTFAIPQITTYRVAYVDYDTLDEAMAVVRQHAANGMARVELQTRTHDATIRSVADRDLADTDRARIGRAFRSLRKTHVTSMGRICCSGCIGAEVGPKAKERGKGVVAFNAQAWSSFDKEREMLTDTLHLQHGEPSDDGDGSDTWDRSPAIVDALIAQGQPATWSGNGRDTITVYPAVEAYCPNRGGEHAYGYCRTCRAIDRKMERAASA